MATIRVLRNATILCEKGQKYLFHAETLRQQFVAVLLDGLNPFRTQIVPEITLARTFRLVKNNIFVDKCSILHTKFKYEVYLERHEF